MRSVLGMYVYLITHFTLDAICHTLPRVVLKFHLLGVTLIGVYGLNLPEVGKLLVPSIPVKLSHMDILVEI